MPEPGRVYSDEFYAAIDAQDFELALAIRDRDKAAEGRVRSVEYLEAVITEAARRLRQENVGHLVATDLEDSLRWTHDPATCAHPFGNCRDDGSTYCRTCKADTSDMEGMGR